MHESDLAKALTGLIIDSTAASSEAKGALEANTKSVDGLTTKTDALVTSIDELVLIRAQELKIQEDESAARIDLRKQEVKALRDQSKGRWRIFDALKPALVPAVAVLAMAIAGAIGAAISNYLQADDPAAIVEALPSITPEG